MADDSDSKQHDEEMPTGSSPFDDVNKLSQGVLQVLMQATKNSNDLPSAGDDFDYYSSFPAFQQLMEMESDRILQLIRQVMRYHGVRGSLFKAGECLPSEDMFDVLVDANDQFLEKAGTFLDTASGVRKTENPLVVASVTTKQNVSGSWNRKVVNKPSSPSTSFRLLTAKNIQRPQNQFKDKIDNTNLPFVPRLTEKPNALMPLSESLISRSDGETETSPLYPHPYQYELDQLEYLPSQLEAPEPQASVKLYDSNISLIEKEEDLTRLCKHLMTVTEIAVDLEHHSYRSFQGFTCLIQISTRTDDYLVDVLRLRHCAHMLNTVFTNPNIVKVFHGADLDIEWLQRDFGVYVVNMFDTGQAARLLSLPRFSLAYLLKAHCEVDADKQYQLADWRIRPLPRELVHYAREDTHYLLYIYDRLRQQLASSSNANNNLLRAVLDRSKQICLKTYVKPVFNEDSHLELYYKSKKVFNSSQMTALKELCMWRNSIARLMDESTGYVLPNHMLLQISDVLPREAAGVLACCNPIPPLVRQNLNEIHEFIKKAREIPLAKTAPAKPVSSPQVVKTRCKYDISSQLRLQHDLSHVQPSQSFTVSSIDTEVPVTTDSKTSMSPFMEIFTAKCSLLGDKQDKVSTIQQTMTNHMEKYLPRTLTDELCRKGLLKRSNIRDDDMWTLLPHTTPRDKKSDLPSVDTTVNASGAFLGFGGAEKQKDWLDDSHHESAAAHESTAAQDNVADSAPIRIKKAKKRKSREPTPGLSAQSPSLDTITQNIEAGLKKARKIVEENKSNFKAYEYNKAAYESLNKGSEKGTVKKKEYNPDAPLDDSTAHRGMSRPRHLDGTGGKKSMTYTKGRDKSHGKGHWPKK